MSGGLFGIAYNPPEGYLFFPNGNPGYLNPLNTGNVEYSIRQPLMRGAGLDVNRAPIRIAQIRAGQSQWEFKQQLLASIRSIVEAYWYLQAAHTSLQALNEIVPLMEEVVRIEEERLAAQRGVRSDVARARANLFAVRQQRLAAESTAYERELRLRNLLGMPPNDGRAIIPMAQPMRGQVTMNLESSLSTALTYRPELIRQQMSIRTRELELMVARNLYRPQLDATGLFRMNGLGPTQGAAIEQIFNGQYNDWQTGLQLNVPLGRRAASATVTAAQTQLQRERAMMRQAVHSTAHVLGDINRLIDFSYRQYLEAENRLHENTEWMSGERVRFQNPFPTNDSQDWLSLALNNYLMALRSQYEAAAEAATLLAQYNTQLARLEEAMGTLATSYNVSLDNDVIFTPKDTQRLARDVYTFALPCPYFTDARVPPAEPAPQQPPTETIAPSQGAELVPQFRTIEPLPQPVMPPPTPDASSSFTPAAPVAQPLPAWSPPTSPSNVGQQILPPNFLFTPDTLGGARTTAR